MRAMLLAAGRGERMGPLTDDLPKPLLRVGDTSLIEYQLARLAAGGFEHIVINLSYRGEQIRQTLGDGSRHGVHIEYSQEPEPPLETAGGIVQALPALGPDRFLLVNSDIWTDFDFARCQSADTSLLVMVPNPRHNPAGDFGIDADDMLTQTPPMWTYAGIAVLSPALFAGLEPGPRPLKPLLDAAIARRELGALRHEGMWLDVGTPERLEQARRLAVNDR